LPIISAPPLVVAAVEVEVLTMNTDQPWGILAGLTSMRYRSKRRSEALMVRSNWKMIQSWTGCNLKCESAAAKAQDVTMGL
jgi:hypothetical protein